MRVRKTLNERADDIFRSCCSQDGWVAGGKIPPDIAWSVSLQMKSCGRVAVLKGHFAVNNVPVVGLDWHAASGKPGAIARGYHFDFRTPFVPERREEIMVGPEDSRGALTIVLGQWALVSEVLL